MVVANPPLCSGKSGIERRVCLEDWLNKEEKNLNKAYENAFYYIDEQAHIPLSGRDEWKRALDKARYTWHSFRDSECDVLVYEWWGSMGNGAGNAILVCNIELTLKRVNVISRIGK